MDLHQEDVEYVPRCRCRWCNPHNALATKHHRMDDADEALLRRWKSHGLSTYTVHVQDDDRHFVFSGPGLELHVDAAEYGVPVFTNDERDVLTMYLDEYEAAPQVVRL